MATNSGLGFAAIGLFTFVAQQFGFNALLVNCLYFVVVTLISLTGDFIAAAVVSVAAFGCLDYFFVQPLYAFAVADSSDLAALTVFLVTALVITRLVSKVRSEAQHSLLQRQRFERLYQLAQHLLLSGALGEEAFLRSFLGVFGVTAVCLFDSDGAQIRTAGELHSDLAQKTRDGYIMGVEINDPVERTTVRRLEFARRVSGAIGFQGLEDPAFNAGPLVALATTFIDRTRALRQANEASAAAQAEQYRSAVLDALAHEFKTPLATIVAAAGALPQVGPLSPAQAEMAETVENEAGRLASLTSRLLRTARLDREEIRPRMEVIDLSSLVHQITLQYGNRSLDRRIVRAYPLDTFEVLADSELLRLSIGQLVDNACKYSLPGSMITIGIERQEGAAVISVTNSRSSIAPHERQRIFERFYRGTDAKRSTSGSGLGLYVARKIAVAHGGTLELDTQNIPDAGVTFRLKLPTLKVEIDDVIRAK